MNWPAVWRKPGVGRVIVHIRQDAVAALERNVTLHVEDKVTDGETILFYKVQT